MSDHVEYGLVVAFPDQSETFTLGVEAGMFWQRIESGERRFSLTAHTNNLEALRRMATARDLILDAWPAMVDGWAEVEVSEPDPRPKLQLIKGGLAAAPSPAEGEKMESIATANALVLLTQRAEKAEQQVERLQQANAGLVKLLRDIRPALACGDTFNPCSDLRERIDAAIEGQPHD